MTTIVFDTFILILKWPNNRLDKMRLYEKSGNVSKQIDVDVILTCMQECPSLSQLDSLAVSFLSTFSCLPLVFTLYKLASC